MTISNNNPKVASSVSITNSIFASGPCVIDKIIWASISATGSIHLMDTRGNMVFSGVGTENLEILDHPQTFPMGLMFASISGKLTDLTDAASLSTLSDCSSTSSTAMESGKLYVWFR
jgi:hypothetical protein